MGRRCGWRAAAILNWQMVWMADVGNIKLADGEMAENVKWADGVDG